MKHVWRTAVLAVVIATLAMPAFAQTVSFKDPVGDDNGPGTYTYPTDTVYRDGLVRHHRDFKYGDKLELAVTQNSSLEDKCWAMQFGFCLQEVFVFIKTDPNTGHTEGLPGLNVQFAPEAGWNKVIIMSPQPASRVRNEVESKVGKALQADVIVPARVKGGGRTIATSVDIEGPRRG